MSIFSTYNVTLQFENKILGGIPKNPDVIEEWIRSKAGVTDEEEIRQMMLKTLVELGADVSAQSTYEELVEASNNLAASKQTNGFKVSSGFLVIEDRQVKALIRECTNILYAGERWGKTYKGPKSYVNERVFFSPQFISLGVTEPDGVELQIIHAQTPQGPRHSLSYSEYVYQPTISFEMKVLRDELKPQEWAELWELAQLEGLGASRSQSYGRFQLVTLEKVNDHNASTTTERGHGTAAERAASARSSDSGSTASSR